MSNRVINRLYKLYPITLEGAIEVMDNLKSPTKNEKCTLLVLLFDQILKEEIHLHLSNLDDVPNIIRRGEGTGVRYLREFTKALENPKKVAYFNDAIEINKPTMLYLLARAGFKPTIKVDIKWDICYD